MKCSGGILLRLCVFAVLAAMPQATSLGQGSQPVTRVIPVASPAASPVATPEAVIPQAPPQATAAASPSASPIATPESSTTPGPAATPGAVTSETTPAISGTSPAVSGTESKVMLVPSPSPPSPYSIELDLAKQRAYLLKEGEIIAESPISSGRAGHLTPTGNFEVVQKDLNHFSNLYGKIVEKGSGRVVKSGADVAMPVPKGCKFEPAPMKFFMRFAGAAGMHAGILPGYPASHGCVRMPLAKAQLFYETVDLGTPVHVFGTPPLRESREREEPRRQSTSRPKATPAPTPKARKGWWPF